MRDSQKNLHDKNLGKKGEKQAVNLLKKQKYKILDKNFTCTFGECDIIAVKDGTIVFAEVKTRYSTSYGSASEAVTKTKQKKYYNIASYYLKLHSLFDCAVRFDVIEVYKDSINHIEGAFSL